MKWPSYVKFQRRDVSAERVTEQSKPTSHPDPCIFHCEKLLREVVTESSVVIIYV